VSNSAGSNQEMMSPALATSCRLARCWRYSRETEAQSGSDGRRGRNRSITLAAGAAGSAGTRDRQQALCRWSIAHECDSNARALQQPKWRSLASVQRCSGPGVRAASGEHPVRRTNLANRTARLPRKRIRSGATSLIANDWNAHRIRPERAFDGRRQSRARRYWRQRPRLANPIPHGSCGFCSGGRLIRSPIRSSILRKAADAILMDAVAATDIACDPQGERSFLVSLRRLLIVVRAQPLFISRVGAIQSQRLKSTSIEKKHPF
jgi:hypothetical protein